jgi:hypothetical protein
MWQMHCTVLFHAFYAFTVFVIKIGVLKQHMSINLVVMASESTDLLIINLKVIAGLQPNERLSVRNGAFEVQEYGYMQSVWRRLGGDTRWVNLNEIKRLIDDALRLLSVYSAYAFQPAKPATTSVAAYPTPLPDNALAVVKTLTSELTAAASGLDNLKTTYAGDSRMVANLDVILQKLRFDVARAEEGVTGVVPLPKTPPPQSGGGQKKDRGSA